MQFPVHTVSTNLRMKRRFNMGSGAAKDDGEAARADFPYAHAVKAEPIHDLPQVAVGDAETPAKALRGKPAVIIRRSGVVQGGQELIEGALLPGVRLKGQDYVLHAVVRGDGPDLIATARQRVAIPGKIDPVLVIDESVDAVPRARGKQFLRGQSAHRWLRQPEDQAEDEKF